MITLLYAHPYEKSFNHGILEQIQTTLQAQEKEYTTIDLYQDGFNPAMPKSELALYSRGQSEDPLVQKYNAILDQTDHIIVLFPVWWYDMPAMLKGFFDRVMLQGSGWQPGENGLVPVRKIHQTTLITTSANTTQQLIDWGDFVNQVIIKVLFADIGFLNTKWLNFDSIETSTPQQRQAFLQTVAQHLTD